jgi:hypothetical protein
MYFSSLNWTLSQRTSFLCVRKSGIFRRRLNTLIAALHLTGSNARSVWNFRSHQGLERGRDAHGHGGDDLLEVAHLSQQPEQPERSQHPQLLDPRVAAPGPNDQEGHRHGDDAGVEDGPAVCAPSCQVGYGVYKGLVVTWPGRGSTTRAG